MSEINIEGQNLSLTDIAGLDTGEVEAQFVTKLPKGLFKFEITSSKLDSRASTQNPGSNYPFIMAECSVLEVINLADQSLNPDDFKGKKHFESWNLSTETQEKFIQSLGFWKGFAQLTGFASAGNLDQMLQQWVGTQFFAPITHRNNPNDSDDPYVNMNRTKVRAADVSTQIEQNASEAAAG